MSGLGIANIERKKKVVFNLHATTKRNQEASEIQEEGRKIRTP